MIRKLGAEIDMGKLVYYVAMSLDGFIARPDHAVDWLMPYQDKLDTPYDYETFYRTVDVILVGRKTMDVAATFEENPYSDRPCYLFTRDRRARERYSYAIPVETLTENWVTELRQKHPGTLWLVGGAEIAALLLKMKQIDEIVLTVAPVTIGVGIPWVNPIGEDRRWKLVEAIPAKNGLLHVVYSKADF